MLSSHTRHSPELGLIAELTGQTAIETANRECQEKTDQFPGPWECYTRFFYRVKYGWQISTATENYDF